MLPALAAPGLCGDPSLREQFDEAYRRPGGETAHEFGRTICNHCPIYTECLTEALVNHEPGFWAGTSPHARTRLRKKARA